MRDLGLLHPKVKLKAERLIQLAKQHGISIIITQTLRNKQEQEELYARGRSKPGSVVTNARYPYSPHCWGVAFDFAVVIGDEVNWDRIDIYDQVGRLGKTLGLFWGGDFKSFVDRPHFEDPEFAVNKSVATLIQKYGTPEKFKESWEAEKMKVNEVTVVVNGKELPVKGIEIDGVSYTPNRALAEALGLNIQWDGVKKQVIFTSADRD